MKDSQLSDLQTPYQTPQSDLEQLKSKSAEYGEFNLFSTKGRVGRVRYLLYSVSQIGILVIVGLMLEVFEFLGGKASTTYMAAAVVVLVIVMFMALISFILTVQRLHDFNMSGVFMLLVIPLMSILIIPLLFIPGTDGPNRFGPPSQTNNPIETRLVIGIWSMVFLAVIIQGLFQHYSRTVSTL